jgi:tetratricopeptide (TPR) repeat protein
VLPDRRTGDDGLPDDGERRSGPRRAWEALTRAVNAPRPLAGTTTRPPSPRTAGDRLAEARLALTDGRYAEAAALAASVAALEPLRADAHRLRGDALVALGEDDAALVALRKALYLDPDDGMAHFLLAGALARTGSAAAAAREYRAASAVLGRRPTGLPAPELGGRSVGELVALCERMAAELEAGTRRRKETA